MSQFSIKSEEQLFAEYRDVMPKGASQGLSQQQLNILSQGKEPARVQYTADEVDVEMDQDSSSQSLFIDDETIETDYEMSLVDANQQYQHYQMQPYQMLQPPQNMMYGPNVVCSNTQPVMTPREQTAHFIERDFSPPALTMHEEVKPSQAIYDSTEKILVADVREIPIILKHGDLSAYSTLVLQFSNWYDKTNELIRLNEVGPCAHDNDTFVEIRGEAVQSTQSADGTTVEYELPAQVELKKLTSLTIFFAFKHSTTCYKKSKQSCFKIQSNSSKSPIFEAQLFLRDSRTGQKTQPLTFLVKVGRNVTREFDKMVNGSHKTIKNHRCKRRSSSLEEIPPKVRYAENDDYLAIVIKKDNPDEVEYWKSQLRHLTNANPDAGNQIYKNCGNKIDEILK